MDLNKIPVAQAVPIDSSLPFPPSGANATAPPLPAFATSQTTGPVSAAEVDETAVRRYLSERFWSTGLQTSLLKGIAKAPMRFMIIDDSGSMASNDGNRLIGTGASTRLTKCTRWSELCDSMRFHAHLAETACAPTEFRLLNSLSPVIVGLGPENDGVNINRLFAAFDEPPGGGTPLCRHIREVTQQIQQLEPQLRANGHKAVIVIATDGESSDGDIATAMRPLKNLPVWVVIRLCTDDDRIVNYWNNIDQELELDMDVLDDMCSEAQEVYSHNPWLTYGEPIHRMREFGITLKEMDLLDEGKLSKDQLQGFMPIIFGGKRDDFPHPESDWKAFVASVKHHNNEQPKVWCPIDGKVSSVIKESKLNSTYHTGCTIM